MAIDYDRLKAWPFQPIEQAYSERDAMLYALGLGLGGDPDDRGQLDFVYEKNLKVLPTMSMVLGTPRFWQSDPRTGIDAVRVVHAEQGLVVHRHLARAGTIRARTRVTAIVDKGKEKGALIAVQRTVVDAATDELLATVDAVTFARGDGGFGDRGDRLPEPHRIPDRAPDATERMQTTAQSALIYRLCGDINPLHADPEVARKAGFPRPLLHGLCTMGIAGYAVLKAFGGHRPESLRSLRVRFSAPVYPGDCIRTDLWRDGNVVSFRSHVDERDAMVLAAGRADLA